MRWNRPAPTSSPRRVWLASLAGAAALILMVFVAFEAVRPAFAQASLTLTGTVSPRQVSTAGTLTYSASASGGDPATTRYAFFRRRPGGTWTPDVNNPPWQASSTYNWNPTVADVGVWETYIWVKDGNTPPTMNTYGYAAGYNTMPIEVFGPPTVPGPTTVSCAWSSGGECWVTGDFTASVSPSTGGLGSLNYHICRSNDTAGWGGCDVHLTMSGGTSITVSGSHLPSDNYRRAYYFQTRDSGGAYSGWNTPLFVKVDRYAPSVSASNASESWFSYRTATVSASDSGSGVQSIRYSWGSPHNGSCTSGSATSAGATLVAPNGDNYLYLCAKDNTGRVGQWSGHYKVSALGLAGGVSPNRGSYLGSFTWTMTATGGNPSTTRFAFFRRIPGGTWIPSVNAPVWQASGTYTWSPTLADVGTWETYVWVKDGDTPGSMNTYGYAAGLNTMPIEVVGKPTVPGPTTVACAYATVDDCWVTGDFTASVTASTGGMGSLVYDICRSVDSSGGFAGCDATITLTGGSSILVSGTHLPADGFRRAYYFQAKDSAGAASGWNAPRYVRVDRYAPLVSASNASDLWFPSRTATVSASDATNGAGANSGLIGVRYSWGSALDAACTTGTATSVGATLTAPTGDNLLYLCARDNTGRVAQWNGRYRVTAPLALTGSISPGQGSYLGGFTYTATATGGDPASTRYAFFHRVPGGTWVPDVNNPNWQPGNTYTWQPLATEAGVWETYIWVKDANTPANQNTYGYAAGFNTGPITVVGKPTVPGPTTVACAYANGDDCWVAGDFTASVTASTGGMGSLVYDICRSVDSSGGFAGCDATITLTGGSSILISGTHLAADGFRRAYYFQAKDSAGALSGWNSPRYVRVDRNGPTVSATNASSSWFSSRTATLSASDSTGGAAANSGLQGVRYSWNTALDGACTTGTATSSGATLTAPNGDNVLYLCAKDNTGRVTQWSGAYRISPMGLSGSVSPTRGSYLGSFTWTMTATGGNPSTTRFAFFRRVPGGTWIPSVNAPVWQASGTYTWSPTLADVGTWETYVWVKDGDTPADANGYGYATGLNTGPIEVVGKPTVPGPTTVSCAYSSGDDCWVAGDFTASATPSSGGMGTLNYHICRSVDSAGGFAGCDVHLTFTGGPSILVSGTHLPANGSRRAFYFQTQDAAGAYSGWNAPRYVRVDRNPPAVNASNASDQWFTSRDAVVSAADDAAGSGLQEVRYRWNTELDSGCTAGSPTTSGATLTAPSGDNVLYLCARDRVGRVAQWEGQYRIQEAPAPEATGVTPSVIHQGQVTVLTVTGANLQDASIYIATESPEDGEVEPLPPSEGLAIGTEPGIGLEGFPTAELIDVNAEGTVMHVRIDATEPGIEGFFNLAIETPGGKTGQPFRVVGTMPVVDLFTPSQPVQGDVHVFMVAGANLQGAEVVPDNPAIKVLDLDNSDDNGLMGLLYVDSGAPAGSYDIRINRPGGESLTLSLDVGGTLSASALPTQKLAIPGRSQQAGVPDVLLQQPVSFLSYKGADLKRLGVPLDGSETQRSFAPAPTAWQFCFWVSRKQSLRFTSVLLSLTDLFGKPLTRQALNQLAPGQRLNFNSTTVAVSASLEFTFYFKICNNWVTTVIYCVKASISYMVPLIGGYAIEFNACHGTEGPRVTLVPEGLIRRHEWSATSSCVTVEDEEPESQSGERRGTIAVDCCTPADIYLHTTGTAFEREFDAQGKVASVQQENCENPGPPQLRVVLDVDRDNIKSDPEYLYSLSELDDSGRYLSCSPLASGSIPPGEGIPPGDLPQQMSVAAFYTQTVAGKLKIVPPPTDVQSVDIVLEDTSKLSGVATNWPNDSSGGPGSGTADPDYWLGSTGDSSGNRSQSVTLSFGSPETPSKVAVANFYCNDYGGTTTLRARPANGALTAPLAIPASDFGNHLPNSGWTAFGSTGSSQVSPGSLQDGSDEDGTPLGAAVGDGLTALSEYRGVVVNRQHYRLNPYRKDLFIEWNPEVPLMEGVNDLGLEIHQPRTDEMVSVATTDPLQVLLYVNLHSMYSGLESAYVPAVHLLGDSTSTLPSALDPNDPPPLGYTKGKISDRGTSGVLSMIYLLRISNFRDRYPQKLPLAGTTNWTIAHEIGHAVDICHREENGQGQPKDTCDDGAEIDPKATIPHGVYFMHSGDVFRRIGTSSNGLASPPTTYHPNSKAQIKLK